MDWSLLEREPPTAKDEQRISGLIDRLEDMLAVAQCEQRIADIETVLVVFRADYNERAELAARLGVTIAKVENALGLNEIIT